MIIRARKQRRFTTVDNAPFEDKRLRWDTRGLLAYLLTKPDGWEIRIEDLRKQEEPEDGGRPTGREKIFRMLRELKRYGYLYRTQVNGADGKFTTVCEVYENPNDNPHLAAADDEQDFPELDDEAGPPAEVGKAVHGKAVDGKAVNGSAVNGKARRIPITDFSNNEGEGITKRGKKEADTPPHLRGWDALHHSGFTTEEQALMNTIRVAFAFHNAEEAQDATRSLTAAGVTDWETEQAELLLSLRRVAKGVAPATLFRDWLSIWNQGATADEVTRLFGRSRETSWWVNGSGMTGKPWPSQVANNLFAAREWETAPAEERLDSGTATRNGAAAPQAISSLQRFADRVNGMGEER